MYLEDDSPGHHVQRSDFIRRLVQAPPPSMASENQGPPIPRRIVQYWHDLKALPDDVQECMNSWSRWGSSGFEYRVFDARSAARFIELSLGKDHLRAFSPWVVRCISRAPQAASNRFNARVTWLTGMSRSRAAADSVPNAATLANKARSSR